MAANQAFELWYFGDGDVVNGMDDPYDIAEAAWVAAEELYASHNTGKPQLKTDGLYFVGIDVIGGYLTEVNVTSPTGIREIDRLNNVNLGKQVIEWLEKKIDN